MSWIILHVLLATDSWRNTAYSSIVTEGILQLAGAYYAGRTAHFAHVNGFYLIGHHDFPHGSDAYLMYIGAITFLVALYYTWYSIWMGSKYYYQPWGNESRDRFSDPEFKELWSGFHMMGLIFVGSWVGSWLFWAGYIKLAGNL